MPLFGPPNVDKLKAKGDIKGLVKALEYQKDPNVYQAASLALVEIGTAAIELLIATLENENDAVRRAAVETLVKLDEPAIEPLIAALKRDAVRKAAAEVLVKMGAPAVESAVERLLAALKGKKKDDIIWEFDALVKIGTPAVDQLVAFLMEKKEKRICTIGGMVFIRAENMKVIPHYSDLVKKFQLYMGIGVDMRGVAAGALGMIGDARAGEALIASLQDEDEFVRWAAAGALFTISDERSLEPLVTNLKDEDLLVKGSGNAWALIGDGQTVKPLIANLTNEDPGVHLHAAETLKKLGWKSG